MYPFLNLGTFHIGTFGLLLWLAAVCAIWVLHQNFKRNGVDADALTIVALATLAGIVGAKTWHELQDTHELALAWRGITEPGTNTAMNFLHWFQSGFAWFGGLLAAIIVLVIQGISAKPNGLTGAKAATRMLDLAAPAAAIG